MSNSILHSSVQNEEADVGIVCRLDDEVPDGHCDMHLASLALGLALSLVERQRDRQVINRWDPFQDLYKLLGFAMKHLFAKRGKAKLKDYVDVLEHINMKANRVSLPNTTRVGGAMLQFQSFLRSLHGLRYYAEQRPIFFDKMLKRSQCRQVAEFEAIMRPSLNLCFSSQADRVEVAGEMVMVLVTMKLDYDDIKVYDVVDVSGKEWDPSTAFVDLPRKKMTIDTAIAERKGIP